MKVRNLTDQDAEHISEWLSDKQWYLPVKSGSFPRVGFVCVNEYEDILAAAYLYHTDSSVSTLTWISTPPRSPDSVNAVIAIVLKVRDDLPEDRDLVIDGYSDALIRSIQATAKSTRVRTIYRTMLLGVRNGVLE